MRTRRSDFFNSFRKVDPVSSGHNMHSYIGEDQLLVLTINTWIPYLYDVPAILGYPKGFQQRFRYKGHWLLDDIKNRHPSKGQRGVIVVRDTKNNINIPLRFFDVCSFTEVNDIYFIDVYLKDLCDFGNTRDKRFERFKKFDDQIQAVHKQMQQIKQQYPFVYFLTRERLRNVWDATNDFSLDENTNWRFINEQLINRSQYKDSNFLKVLVNDNDHLSSLKDITTCINYANGKFSLKSGESYYIDLLQIIEMNDATKKQIQDFHSGRNFGDIPSEEKQKLARSVPYEVSLTTSTEHLNVTHSKRIAVGEYDRIRFFVNVGDVDQDREAFIEIKAHRDSEGSYSQPLILPIKIRRRLRSRIASSALWGVSVLCAGVDDLIVPVVRYFDGNLPQRVVDNVQSLGILSICLIIAWLTFRVDLFKFK